MCSRTATRERFCCPLCCKYSRFIISRCFPLFKSDGIHRASRQAISQAVTIIFSQQLGLSVYHANGTFMTGCRTSTTAGGSHAASSIRNTNRRCARPAAIRLGSDDAKLPPGGTDSASDASSTSRTSGTGDIACFGSFKRRDTGVPTQSGRAACGRCRGNTSVPA